MAADVMARIAALPATHPARVIVDDLQERFHPAAAYLVGHEDEHNVTFVAVDQDALARLREVYDKHLDAQWTDDARGAYADLSAAVAAILGEEN